MNLQAKNLQGDEENLIDLDDRPSVSSRSSVNYGFYQNAEQVIRDDRGSIQSNFESFERLRTPISRHTFDN